MINILSYNKIHDIFFNEIKDMSIFFILIGIPLSAILIHKQCSKIPWFLLYCISIILIFLGIQIWFLFIQGYCDGSLFDQSELINTDYPSDPDTNLGPVLLISGLPIGFICTTSIFLIYALFWAGLRYFKKKYASLRASS